MNTAFITGHRVIHLRHTQQGIRQLTHLAIERGIITFLSGMALGTDQLAASIWSEMNLDWQAIIPCKNQSVLWTIDQQVHYRKLLVNANEIKVLYPKYKPGVMQARNQFMVKHSSLGLAIWDGYSTTGSGTFLTVQMARKAKLPIIIFNPQTQEITFEPQHQQLSFDL
ncbi:SLOG family protein [Lyngbya sp. PCC 8106]|uniref:SLOG family protein n=1 Tax=Lyngbya sp. (strain PCC 8106) TaxID=313612 RepID=UPI0000EA98A9|nr:SLOG family protein [Lyngbya sp. PCC 8106]EAW35121.1 hypothetical protein L8106_13440 [Lyngbya sp. PCC 8106]